MISWVGGAGSASAGVGAFAGAGSACALGQLEDDAMEQRPDSAKLHLLPLSLSAKCRCGGPPSCSTSRRRSPSQRTGPGLLGNGVHVRLRRRALGCGTGMCGSTMMPGRRTTAMAQSSRVRKEAAAVGRHHAREGRGPEIVQSGTISSGPTSSSGGVQLRSGRTMLRHFLL